LRAAPLDPLSGLSLRARLSVAIGALLLLIFALTMQQVVSHTRSRLERDLAEKAQRDLAVLAELVGEMAILGDYPAIEQLLATRVRHTDIAALVYDQGRVRLAFGDRKPAQAPPPWFRSLTALHAASVGRDLSFGGVSYGHIELSLDPREQEQLLWSMFIRVGLVFGGALLLAWVALSWLLGSLRALARASDTADTGELHASLATNPRAPPEVRQTAATLARMGNRIGELASVVDEQRDVLALEKRQWEVTLGSIGDGVIITDTSGTVRYLNRAAERLTGWEQPRAEGRGLSEILPLASEPGDHPMVIPLHDCLSAADDASTSLAASLTRGDGARLSVQIQISRLMATRPTGCVLVIRDETERQMMLEELRFLAYHDPLTGLPNRRAVEGRLSRALRGARAEGRRHLFAYLDLDRFKVVNDTCGHPVGDTLLRQVAALMQERLPSQAYLGRLGGDEFGLVLFDIDAEAGLALCRALSEAIAAYRFVHAGHVFSVGASVGLAEIDADAPGEMEIMSRADRACYEAKLQPADRVQLYHSEHAGLRQREEETLWVAKFRRAHEENRFRLYRQAIVSLSEPGARDHYEILLRMVNVDGTVEAPGPFLAAAERHGLALTLDHWVIETLCAYLGAHPQDTARYSVNLSGLSLGDPRLAEFILGQLARHGVDPSRLDVEITETAAVHHMTEARALIDALRERGCRASLDDFGSGMSSFAYLRHLPVDSLKIDGGFVRELNADRTNYVIVNAIAQIGRELDCRTVAESVESAELLERLREIGVDSIQGNLVHAPEPLPLVQPGARRRAAG
jgi:diguanylate cyclase (GGDEF)-like protein/PAS domain S-box-containing protein